MPQWKKVGNGAILLDDAGLYAGKQIACYGERRDGGLALRYYYTKKDGTLSKPKNLKAGTVAEAIKEVKR